jgi:hypothetical protein
MHEGWLPSRETELIISIKSIEQLEGSSANKLDLEELRCSGSLELLLNHHSPSAFLRSTAVSFAVAMTESGRPMRSLSLRSIVNVDSSSRIF